MTAQTPEEMAELIAQLRTSYNARGVETFNTIIEGFAWRSSPPTRYIVAAATHALGVVYQLPPPARHNDVMKIMPSDRRDLDFDFGFVTNDGVFVSREQAWEIAREAGQFIRRCGGDYIRLYSENLW